MPDPFTVSRHHLPHLTPRKLLALARREELHPVVLAEAEHRAASVQLRVADAITAFAGSMRFVYLHVLLFVVWMLVFERTPWPTLTLIVSLEAIFLSTFVMIGQNRQAAFQQAKADRDYTSSEKLLEENTDLTRVIHELSQQIHEMVKAEVQAQAAAKTVKEP
ncbi:hypothetical protein AS850_13995 [Frondihabitans sp. 762G35]|uniref:DUF1003 domain-containing protein n=1 Tax=Frondihabitans sp. 762G35 TaxID=1446794 RepID=UPI000D1FE56E|nr:DUF1003 domain-containing protein [Frondihabitans sp. 762G35]ARC58192.1 hypothetical protein AS850_13995 [Frondihabitans sp. 762G35]